MAIILGVPRETFPGERRVAITPKHCETLSKIGVITVIESGAGDAAGFDDDAYIAHGTRCLTRGELFAEADIVAQVRVASANPEAALHDLPLMRPGQVLIGFADPLGNPEPCFRIAETGVSLFALELVPRITRAQSMDALSSMATIAGYRAVLLAAVNLPRLFPMLMTAAGTVKPAKVFVLGAGVAGLQAIATARRLGAVVSAYDVRPTVKEQVESVGAKFVSLELDAGSSEGAGGYARAMDEAFYARQREMLMRIVPEHDVVITTAAVPGRKSPVLISSQMILAMQPGSIVVDIAAERGGNCEPTRAGETIQVGSVTVMGPLNLPSSVPYHASQLYSGNITAFVKLLVRGGEIVCDLQDQILRETLICCDGQIVNAAVGSTAVNVK